MSDFDTRGGIALHVGKLCVHGGVIEEGGHDVAGIIKHHLHSDVFRSLDDGGHVVSLVVKHHGDSEEIRHTYTQSNRGTLDIHVIVRKINIYTHFHR